MEIDHQGLKPDSSPTWEIIMGDSANNKNPFPEDERKQKKEEHKPNKKLSSNPPAKDEDSETFLSKFPELNSELEELFSTI